MTTGNRLVGTQKTIANVLHTGAAIASVRAMEAPGGLGPWTGSPLYGRWGSDPPHQKTVAPMWVPPSSPGCRQAARMSPYPVC